MVTDRLEAIVLGGVGLDHHHARLGAAASPAGHLLAEGGFGEVARAASERVGVVVGEVLARAQETGRIRTDIGVEEIYFLVRGVAQAQAFLPVDPGVRRRAVRVLIDGLRCAPSPRTPAPMP